MDDVWKDVRKQMRSSNVERAMKYGIFCFQVVQIDSLRKVKNTYDRISKEKRDSYLENLGVDKKEGSQYQQYITTVRVKYWPKVSRKDQLVKVPITSNILCNIRGALDKFTEYKLPEPELILFWKPTKMIVRYTFLYEEQFEDYLDIIRECDTVKLKHTFYWLGAKEYYDEKMFIDWYRR